MEFRKQISLERRRFSFDGSFGKTLVPDSKQHFGLELLRWLGVLPCAYLAHWLLQGFGYALFSILRSPAYPEFLFPLLQYFPSGITLVVVGAMIAPRRRVGVAIVLAAVSMYASWKTHIGWQSTRGLVNYMHVTGDSLGLLVGFVLIFRRFAQAKVETTTDAIRVSDESSPE